MGISACKSICLFRKEIDLDFIADNNYPKKFQSNEGTDKKEF